MLRTLNWDLDICQIQSGKMIIESVFCVLWIMNREKTILNVAKVLFYAFKLSKLNIVALSRSMVHPLFNMHRLSSFIPSTPHSLWMEPPPHLYFFSPFPWVLPESTRPQSPQPAAGPPLSMNIMCIYCSKIERHICCLISVIKRWHCTSTRQRQTPRCTPHHTVPRQQQRPNSLLAFHVSGFKSEQTHLEWVGEMCSRQSERTNESAWIVSGTQAEVGSHPSTGNSQPDSVHVWKMLSSYWFSRRIILYWCACSTVAKYPEIELFRGREKCSNHEFWPKSVAKWNLIHLIFCWSFEHEFSSNTNQICVSFFFSFFFLNTLSSSVPLFYCFNTPKALTVATF